MTPQAKPSGINFAGARRSLGGQQARIKLEMQDAPAWRVRDITVSPAKVEVSSPIRGAPRESVTEEERKVNYLSMISPFCYEVLNDGFRQSKRDERVFTKHQIPSLVETFQGCLPASLESFPLILPPNCFE